MVGPYDSSERRPWWLVSHMPRRWCVVSEGTAVTFFTPSQRIHHQPFFVLFSLRVPASGIRIHCSTTGRFIIHLTFTGIFIFNRSKIHPNRLRVPASGIRIRCSITSCFIQHLTIASIFISTEIKIALTRYIQDGLVWQ